MAKLKQVCVAIIILMGLMYIYGISQYIIATPGINIESKWDRKIPFIPQMIFFYLLLFPYVLITSWLLNFKEIIVAVYSCCLACAIAEFFFLFCPMYIQRPAANAIDNEFLRQIFFILHQKDLANNTFPSLHVAISWICAFSHSKKKAIWIFLALAISSSTLLVKQHYIYDVLAGFLLAILCLQIVKRFNKS